MSDVHAIIRVVSSPNDEPPRCAFSLDENADAIAEAIIKTFSR
jgi:hypothetical protein